MHSKQPEDEKGKRWLNQRRANKKHRNVRGKSKGSGKKKKREVEPKRDGFTSYNVYHQYIKSDVWKARKIRYWKEHDRKAGCRLCGSRRKIELHHKTYARANGQERDEDLMPVCKRCHDAIHDLVRSRKAVLANAHHVYIGIMDADQHEADSIVADQQDSTGVIR